MAFETNALGVDVSLWQKTVDWDAMRQAGVSFAFAKASEGDAIKDPYFDKNWAGLKAAGIVRGAYHFFRPAKDAVKQAALFARTVSLEDGDLPLALDLESNGGLEPARLVPGIAACLTELERLTGRRPIIYTGPNFWNTSVAVPSAPDWTANYALWIANYTTGSKPLIPKGWSEWTVWQYTDKGKLPGVAGNVDLDRYKGTVNDLLAWVGLGAQPAAQPQTPSPADVVKRYSEALTAGDLDAVLALYLPNAVRVLTGQTLQGLAAVRAFYQDWLTNKYPGGEFNVTNLVPTEASWTFNWTVRSRKGAGQGSDTLAVVNGQIQYHTTSYDVVNVSVAVPQTPPAPAASGVTGELMLLQPDKTVYAVGERVAFHMEIRNTTDAPIKYSYLGLTAKNLKNAQSSFQSSWSGDGLTLPARGMGPISGGWEDGVQFSAPGAYRVTLDICFASLADGQKSLGWEKLTPGLEIVIK